MSIILRAMEYKRKLNELVVYLQVVYYLGISI